MSFLTITKDTKLEVKAMVDLGTLHMLSQIAIVGLGAVPKTPDLITAIQELICSLVNPIRPLPEITE